MGADTATGPGSSALAPPGGPTDTRTCGHAPSSTSACRDPCSDSHLSDTGPRHQREAGPGPSRCDQDHGQHLVCCVQGRVGGQREGWTWQGQQGWSGQARCRAGRQRDTDRDCRWVWLTSGGPRAPSQEAAAHGPGHRGPEGAGEESSTSEGKGARAGGQHTSPRLCEVLPGLSGSWWDKQTQQANAPHMHTSPSLW